VAPGGGDLLREETMGLILADAQRLPLRDGCVHTCVTSPPYWGLRDYGTPSQIGLERTPEEYVANLVTVFEEVRRVLRDDGTLWLNLGDSYATGAGAVGSCPGGGKQGARWAGDVDRVRDTKRSYRRDRAVVTPRRHQGVGSAFATRTGAHDGKHKAMAALGPMTQPNRMPIPGLKPKDLVGIPWRVAFALQAAGWWLRADIIWHKPNPMPESVTDRPTKCHEYLFLLSKSERYYYDHEAIREPYEYGYHHRNVLGPVKSHTPNGAPHKSLRKSGSRKSGNKARVYGDDRDRPGSHIGAGVPWIEGDGRNRRSVWTVATTPYKGAHFATFPEALIKPCILAGAPPLGIVLDPFVGSGTTVKVATDLGRVGVGSDANRKYLHEQASRRVVTTIGIGI
jgi:DNA modification methylase